MMAVAYFHVNMIRKCRGKARFPTREAANDCAKETMTVIFCPLCQQYHHTSARRDNYLGMTATPDEVLEMFR